MRISRGINFAHGLLTAALLIFIWLNHQPDPRAGDTLQSVRQISPELWLYTTQNNEGGATVPTVYRYYLRTDKGATVLQLHDDIPFITGGGTISAISVKGNVLHIDYSGSVFGIERKVHGYYLTYSLN